MSQKEISLHTSIWTSNWSFWVVFLNSSWIITICELSSSFVAHSDEKLGGSITANCPYRNRTRQTSIQNSRDMLERARRHEMIIRFLVLLWGSVFQTEQKLCVSLPKFYFTGTSQEVRQNTVTVIHLSFAHTKCECSVTTSLCPFVGMPSLQIWTTLELHIILAKLIDLIWRNQTRCACLIHREAVFFALPQRAFLSAHLLHASWVNSYRVPTNPPLTLYIFSWQRRCRKLLRCFALYSPVPNLGSNVLELVSSSL